MADNWYKGERWLGAPRHVLSAGVVVRNDIDELLLVKSPWRGWEMPGGQIELSEPIRDAARREVFEESGIEIEIERFCGIYQTVSKSICNLLFLARSVGGDLTTSAETTEVGFFTIAQAMEMVTYPTFRNRISDCLEERDLPFLVEYQE